MLLRDEVLPDLLRVSREEVAESIRKRITWGVKRTGLEVPYPTHNVPANFETLEH